MEGFITNAQIFEYSIEMKKFIVFLLLFSLVEVNFAQKVEPSVELSENIISYDSVEEKPEFEGGMMGFYNFIGKSYRLPTAKVKGKIEMQFVIEKDGSVTNIKVLKDLGHGTGKEAVRVLKKCPKWEPGKHNGETVRVLHSLPINILSN